MRELPKRLTKKRTATENVFFFLQGRQHLGARGEFGLSRVDRRVWTRRSWEKQRKRCVCVCVWHQFYFLVIASSKYFVNGKQSQTVKSQSNMRAEIEKNTESSLLNQSIQFWRWVFITKEIMSEVKFQLWAQLLGLGAITSHLSRSVRLSTIL